MAEKFGSADALGLMSPAISFYVSIRLRGRVFPTLNKRPPKWRRKVWRMNENSLKTRYDVAQTIARQAGKTALDFFHNRGDIAVRMKGAQDRVTDVDLEIERFIRRELAQHFPEDDFLGEEMEKTEGDSSMGDRLWVVDPIDGTDCFVFGIPAWCISIAWVENGKIKIGVIYDPVHDELYAAGLGYGAWLNGERISVSAADDCGAGIVGIGLLVITLKFGDKNPGVAGKLKAFTETDSVHNWHTRLLQDRPTFAEKRTIGFDEHSLQRRCGFFCD